VAKTGSNPMKGTPRGREAIAGRMEGTPRAPCGIARFPPERHETVGDALARTVSTAPLHATMHAHATHEPIGDFQRPPSSPGGGGGTPASLGNASTPSSPAGSSHAELKADFDKFFKERDAKKGALYLGVFKLGLFWAIIGSTLAAAMFFFGFVNSEAHPIVNVLAYLFLVLGLLGWVVITSVPSDKLCADTLFAALSPATQGGSRIVISTLSFGVGLWALSFFPYVAGLPCLAVGVWIVWAMPSSDRGALHRYWCGGATSTSCFSCENAFDFQTRRHYCRHCMRDVCAACKSPHRFTTLRGEPDKRACKECCPNAPPLFPDTLTAISPIAFSTIVIWVIWACAVVLLVNYSVLNVVGPVVIRVTLARQRLIFGFLSAITFSALFVPVVLFLRTRAAHKSVVEKRGWRTNILYRFGDFLCAAFFFTIIWENGIVVAIYNGSMEGEYLNIFRGVLFLLASLWRPLGCARRTFSVFARRLERRFEFNRAQMRRDGSMLASLVTRANTLNWEARCHWVFRKTATADDHFPSLEDAVDTVKRQFWLLGHFVVRNAEGTFCVPQDSEMLTTGSELLLRVSFKEDADTSWAAKYVGNGAPHLEFRRLPASNVAADFFDGNFAGARGAGPSFAAWRAANFPPPPPPAMGNTRIPRGSRLQPAKWCTRTPREASWW
jgi:hypothetical protein